MRTVNTPDRPPVLDARDLRRTYDADGAPVRALRGVDLQVGQGEFVALTGPSGSGKSTLLRLAAGLERPDLGALRILGTDLGTLTERQLAALRAHRIGIVFQFFHLVDDLSALDNVALAALIGGSGRRAATERAHELLDLLGLLDKARALPPTLSGGQRQRLAIARALANRPDLLLADEPTGSLDTDGSAEVLELFCRLHRGGQTILVVTHDHEVAARADRTVQLRDGRIEATSDQVRR
jgi:putative ABC transport system ATP-binding protein